MDMTSALIIICFDEFVSFKSRGLVRLTNMFTSCRFHKTFKNTPRDDRTVKIIFKFVRPATQKGCYNFNETRTYQRLHDSLCGYLTYI
jgi:hypothetical protein